MITIKIGGSVVDNLHPTTISDIKKVAEKEGVIIVHGGGKEVTKDDKTTWKRVKVCSITKWNQRVDTLTKKHAEIFTMVMSGTSKQDDSPNVTKEVESMQLVFLVWMVK